MCVPTIMWRARELNQFCSAFCFPQKREGGETKERAQSSAAIEARCLEKCECDVSEL